MSLFRISVMSARMIQKISLRTLLGGIYELINFLCFLKYELPYLVTCCIFKCTEATSSVPLDVYF